jgi:signal transduction histidine kinase
MSPVYSFNVGPADGVRLGGFVLVAGLVSVLQAAARRLQELQRRQDQNREQSLAVLAHELRTPLAAIINSLEILRHSQGGDSRAEPLWGIVQRQAQHMARLIGELLDACRIDRGKTVLCKAKLDLVSAVSDAVEAVRPLIEERRHRLQIVLPPEPVYLEADRMRLEQIIVNLLTNAARYTEPGGHIRLVVERGPDVAVLRVRDTGIGIAPAKLSSIFELFVQEKRGSQGGLGIGLHVVAGLVRLHGGSVTALSAGPGQGSEFLVRLPLSGERSEERAPDGTHVVSLLGDSSQTVIPRRTDPARPVLG